MSKLLPWPDLAGAKTAEGRVCVGGSFGTSRSRGRTIYFAEGHEALRESA